MYEVSIGKCMMVFDNSEAKMTLELSQDKIENCLNYFNSFKSDWPLFSA